MHRPHPLISRCGLGASTTSGCGLGMVVTSAGARADNRKSAIGNRKSAIENRQSTIENRKSAIENRQSGIENRKSAIENRQSRIENRKSTIENRQSRIENRKIEYIAFLDRRSTNGYQKSAIAIFVHFGAPYVYPCMKKNFGGVSSCPNIALREEPWCM